MAELNENVACGSKIDDSSTSAAGSGQTDFTADIVAVTTMGSKGTTTTPPPALPSISSISVSKEQKLAALNKNRGAITWNPAKFQGGRRWDVILYPYERKSDHLVLTSRRPPSGATVVRDANSAIKTAKILYGKAPNKALAVSDKGFEQLPKQSESPGRISLQHQPLGSHGKFTLKPKASFISIGQELPAKQRAFPLRSINKLT
jgi:hypothetical protein